MGDHATDHPASAAMQTALDRPSEKMSWLRIRMIAYFNSVIADGLIFDSGIG